MAIISDDLIEFNVDEEEYNNFIETYITPTEVVLVFFSIILDAYITH